MCETENCYRVCINKAFLPQEQLLNDAQKIVAHLEIKASVGRPGIEFKRGLSGIYYLLKTGIHWKALPRCFGSQSAVHRLFQKLRVKGFFEKLWHHELQKYDSLHRLDLTLQAGDCAHIKAPLGKEKTGNSPVDRKKLGTKRSIIVDGNGIVIGMALGPGNIHDSKLFGDSIKSIPRSIQQPYYKEMHLDSAYDSKHIATMLFNYYYVPKIAKNNRNSKKKSCLKSNKKRWVVERTHSWMNRFRRLLIRFEKYANNYFALMHFALSIIIFNKL